MAFTPRLTDSGIENNPLWYANNPFYQAGYGMPNCTCYAWGRRYEITGTRPDTSLGNGRTWYEYAQAAGQSVGATPRLGAIACFTDTREDYPGHVGIVEEITEQAAVLSNSNYGGPFFVVWSVEEILRNNPTFRLQGYIYLDGEPQPSPTSKKLPFIYYLKPYWKYFTV